MVKNLLIALSMLISVGLFGQARDLDINRTTHLKSGMSIGISGSEIDSIQIVTDTVKLYSGGSQYNLITNGGGSGDVTKVGTPVNNQLGVWTGDGTIEGLIALTFDGTDLDIDGNITSATWNGAAIDDAYIDKSLTGMSVNGVTLSSTGGATSFLNETGSYSTPAGGGDMSVEDSTGGSSGNDYYMPTTQLNERFNNTTYGIIESDSGLTYISPHEFDSTTQAQNDSIVSLRSDIGTGSGGSSTTQFKFIVGTTVNAPTAGDDTLQNSAFYNKHLEAWKTNNNVVTQFYNIPITNDSTANFSKVWADGDSVVINVTDLTAWDSGVLTDTTPTGTDLTADLIASYNLDETSGVTAFDETSNDYDLTNSNATVNQTGLVDQCYSFNGTSSYLGSLSIVDEQTFTVSAWFNTSTSDGTEMVIASNYGYSGGYVGWSIFVDGEFTYWNTISVRVTVGGTNYRINTTSDITDGSWHHVLFTFTSGTQEVYIDNTLEGSATHTGTIPYTAGDFEIGRSSVTAEEFWFNGLIDAVNCYDVVVDSDVRDGLYNSGSGAQPY